MVNVEVTMEDGTVREFPKVTLRFPRLGEGKNKWVDLVPKKGDPICLNFSAYSLREVVPEKIKIRKSDGEVLNNGTRVTGRFVNVSITKEGSLHD